MRLVRNDQYIEQYIEQLTTAMKDKMFKHKAADEELLHLVWTKGRELEFAYSTVFTTST